MSDASRHDPASRRPIASRRFAVFASSAAWLARRGVSPNLISCSSVLFAGVTAYAICCSGGAHARLCWIVAAVGVQLRLLANLLDGMVAVEHQQSSPTGELFNEIPDRLADMLVLVPLGFVAGSSPHLGWLAALLSVFVAYVRSMGVVAGGTQVFAGVMSKPVRMFLVTVLCLLMALAPEAWTGAWLPYGLGPPGALLLLICLGCVVTVLTRLKAISAQLRVVR